MKLNKTNSIFKMAALAIVLFAISSCGKKTAFYKLEITTADGKKVEHELNSTAVLAIESGGSQYGVRFTDKVDGADLEVVNVSILHDTLKKETTVTSSTLDKKSLKKGESFDLNLGGNKIGIAITDIIQSPVTREPCGGGCCSIVSGGGQTILCCTTGCKLCGCDKTAVPTPTTTNPNGPETPKQPSLGELIKANQAYVLKD